VLAQFAIAAVEDVAAEVVAAFLEPARRHPVVLVLLHALVIERGDELLDLFQKLLLRLSDGRARRRVDEKRRSTARQRDDLADLGKRLSVILLECAATVVAQTLIDSTLASVTPRSSVTVSVTSYVPGTPKVCVTSDPVIIAPSPKFQW